LKMNMFMEEVAFLATIAQAYPNVGTLVSGKLHACSNWISE
jgi:hypothetical protein